MKKKGRTSLPEEQAGCALKERDTRGIEEKKDGGRGGMKKRNNTDKLDRKHGGNESRAKLETGVCARPNRETCQAVTVFVWTGTGRVPGRPAWSERRL